MYLSNRNIDNPTLRLKLSTLIEKQVTNARACKNNCDIFKNDENHGKTTKSDYPVTYSVFITFINSRNGNGCLPCG